MKIQSSKFRIRNFGFTLVELLIVIALIGILAGAIVATLNPVEQVNKARDARYDNETAELLAALERYYASLQTYPWLEMADGPLDRGDIGLEDEWAGSSLACGAGILGAANFMLVDSTDECVLDAANPGKLIDSQEVKPAFMNKAQFDTTEEATEYMYIYKQFGAGGSVYSCFVPKSNTNRQNVSRLRCLNTDANTVPQGYAQAGSNTWVGVGAGDCAAPLTADDAAWATTASTGLEAIFFCVPE